jgi:nitroimidazol reductase NimA-like FMN-containing flavoprotein (pyridoxamine 5'-phosphate oxidase superfamily)
MTELTEPQIAYLASQRLGRIATAGADHKPHGVPTSYGSAARSGDTLGHAA